MVGDVDGGKFGVCDLDLWVPVLVEAAVDLEAVRVVVAATRLMMTS